MILDFSYPAPSCNEVDTRPSVVKDVHFFYVALILFVLTGVVCVVVSLLTKPPGDELVNVFSQTIFSLINLCICICICIWLNCMRLRSPF